MANRVPINLNLDTFEGPLDLLLHLIAEHEMDVSKLSISKITDQYLAHVLMMQELNFDLASEFLVMAATLVLWKSKALLPKEDSGDLSLRESADEILTPEQLLRQLLEHQRFLDAGAELGRLPKLGEDVFSKDNQKPPVERVWKPMNVSQLALAYQDTQYRQMKRTTVLRKETVSITDRIQLFAQHLEMGIPKGLRTMMSEKPLKPEIVASFLASLELSRLKKLRLYQQEVYQEIYLELIDTLIGFDPSLAIGFEAEIQASIAQANAHQAATHHKETANVASL